jgi:hypothetical protein
MDRVLVLEQGQIRTGVDRTKPMDNLYRVVEVVATEQVMNRPHSDLVSVDVKSPKTTVLQDAAADLARTTGDFDVYGVLPPSPRFSLQF